MKDVRLTHIGGRTLLMIEAAGWRLLTDPTFDAPGERYFFGRCSGSTSRRAGRTSERELARAPLDIRQRFRWLPIGIAE